jgi:hypothetical protein
MSDAVITNRTIGVLREAQTQPTGVTGGVHNSRDPALAKFEWYILGSLSASDICKDEEGVYMFNINQVAYLVEGCKTQYEQKAIKKKLKEHILNVRVQMRQCKRTGNSEYMIAYALYLYMLLFISL